MAYVQKNGFFKRFFSGIGAVFTGIILVIISVILLGWNEARSVKTAKAIKDVDSVKVQLQEPKFDAANNDKLVAVKGQLTYATAVFDTAWNITGNFVLERYVESYQFREEKSGGSTESETRYEAKLQWVSFYESSASYHDTVSLNGRSNSNIWTGDFTNTKNYTSDAKLGDFKLDDKQLGALRLEVLTPTAAATKPAGYTISGSYITNGSSVPQFGDIRV